VTKKKSRKKKVDMDGHEDPWDDFSGVNSAVRGDSAANDDHLPDAAQYLCEFPAVRVNDHEAHVKANANYILEHPGEFDECGDLLKPHFELFQEMKKEALKHDSGKPRMDLVSPLALLELGKVLAYGVVKYNDHNWRENGGLDWSRPLAALHRHLLAWQGGEDIDPESGLPHLAHAMCNAMFLLEYQLTGNGRDNRYKVGLLRT
jgi:hypothetical protein